MPGYTGGTVLIPLAYFSPEGEACAALAPTNGNRVEFVWYMNAALYFVYVCSMLSVTYYSFMKDTCFSKSKEIL